FENGDIGHFFIDHHRQNVEDAESRNNEDGCDHDDRNDVLHLENRKDVRVRSLPVQHVVAKFTLKSFGRLLCLVNVYDFEVDVGDVAACLSHESLRFRKVHECATSVQLLNAAAVNGNNLVISCQTY